MSLSKLYVQDGLMESKGLWEMRINDWSIIESVDLETVESKASSQRAYGTCPGPIRTDWDLNPMPKLGLLSTWYNISWTNTFLSKFIKLNGGAVWLLSGTLFACHTLLLGSVLPPGTMGIERTHPICPSLHDCAAHRLMKPILGWGPWTAINLYM